MDLLTTFTIQTSYGTNEEMDHALDRPPQAAIDEARPQSIKNYISNPYQLVEFIACVLFITLSHIAPSRIFRMGVYERDIPYLQTANGDIILDQTFNRPFVDGEIIPDWLLILLCPVLTAIIVLPMAYFFGPKGDTHAAICALMFGGGCSEFFTSFFKLYVGYLRPNFYNLCDFTVDNLRCEAEESVELQSRLSFPSGHASLSFCCGTFLTLFFFGKIGLHHLKTMHFGGSATPTFEVEKAVARIFLKKRVLLILATMPVSLAMFISASRVRDDMHHPADIICGALIGFISAIFAYGLWYHGVSSSFPGIPLQTATENLYILKGEEV